MTSKEQKFLDDINESIMYAYTLRETADSDLKRGTFNGSMVTLLWARSRITGESFDDLRDAYNLR